jgi:hypothetical protein
VILRRTRGGLYKLCGVGLAAIVGGSFLIKLTPLAIVAGVAASLLCGASGLLVEVVEKSIYGEDPSAD